jgi:MFS family permease
LAFAMLVTSLDQYIVVVALPEIGRELGYSAQTLQAVISANVVGQAGFMLLGGRAADILGRRRIFVWGLVFYAGASLAGGLADTPEFLLIARALQGLSGGLVFPATLSLVNTTFTEGPERNRALAVWGGAGAAGLVVGVLLGGVLTHAFGWPAVFFVNVPLAGLAALAAFSLIPADVTRAANRSFDLPGVLSATLGVTLIVFALVQGPTAGWGSPAILTSAAASVLLLWALAVIERRSRDPLLPPRLLANPNLRSAVAIAFLFAASFGSVHYFLTIYFQDVHGYSPLKAGAGFLLSTTVVVAGSALAGKLATSMGLRATLVSALSSGALGALALGLAMSPDRPYAALIPGLIALSVGDGIVFTTIFIAAGTGVSDHEQGVASAIASTSTSVGAAVGLAVLVLVANSQTAGLTGDALRIATVDGTSAAMFVVAAIIVATTPVALKLRREGTDEEGQCPRRLTLLTPRSPGRDSSD